MAQVARSIEIDIDWLLEFHSREWHIVACVASAWDTWDQEARTDYLSEWPIIESYGEVLQDAVDRDRLTHNQVARYRRLLELMTASRPSIDEMLERG